MHTVGAITPEVECAAAEEGLKTAGVVRDVVVFPKTGVVGLLHGVEVETWHREDEASLNLRKVESKNRLK